MPVHNQDIAAIFDEMADRLEIRGDNPFRVRAYRNASRTVLDLGEELRDTVDQEMKLTDLPGIGKDLAKKIEEILETGKAEALEKLRDDMPAGITELLKLSHLGPKRVKALYDELGIETMDQLADAARAKKIRGLSGFGEKTEKQILEAIERQSGASDRVLRAAAAPYADALTAYLRKLKGVKKVALAGSYRRARETVGDLDILVMAEGETTVMDSFVHYDEVDEVLAQGETKSSVVLRSGLQVDLRVVPRKSFGAALAYFTGSKAHNIRVRKLGQDRRFKINEYGVFRGDEYRGGATEEEVYGSVGLEFVPPELREDRGEIDAARDKKLPSLVEEGDIRGDLHLHTRASDGRNTIEEMALAARSLGYRYMAVTEHSQRLAMIGGLNEKKLRKQMQKIDELNAELDGFTVLKGIEVDILEDGSLDLPDRVLADLDLVVASIHSHFNLSRKKQTDRILKAMDRPHFSVLAHPTGRLLLDRAPYNVDLKRVIRKAAQRGCCLELNSHPLRLDLNDIYCRMAKEAGVLICINTDAHSVGDFDNIRFGVGQARRGWLEKADVLNTRTLKQLRAVLDRTMSRNTGSAGKDTED